MYSALGLRSLKDQKDHYRKFIKKEAVQQEVTPAMEHGTKTRALYKVLTF